MPKAHRPFVHLYALHARAPARAGATAGLSAALFRCAALSNKHPRSSAALPPSSPHPCLPVVGVGVRSASAANPGAGGLTCPSSSPAGVQRAAPTCPHGIRLPPVARPEHRHAPLSRPWAQHRSEANADEIVIYQADDRPHSERLLRRRCVGEHSETGRRKWANLCRSLHWICFRASILAASWLWDDR